MKNVQESTDGGIQTKEVENTVYHSYLFLNAESECENQAVS